MKYSAFKVAFISCLFAGIGPLFADTEVGGLLLDNETWSRSNSPYVVTSSIIIGNDATLTIEPDVVVKIDGGLSIIVGSQSDGEGTLIAEGLSGEPVTFTSNAASPEPGDWSHIHFSSYAKGAVIATLYDEYQQPMTPEYDSGCKLEHVIVEYGGYGDFAVLFAEETRLYLNNCDIRNNAAFALEINDSTGARDMVNHTDFPLVKDCNFRNNAGGLFLADVDNYTLTGNHIHQNQGAGIILDSGSWNLIHDNTINNNWYPLRRRNRDDIFGGLILQSGTNNEIVGNIICHNASCGDGGGMGVYSGYNNTVMGNIICNNSAESNGGGIYNTSNGAFTINIICGNVARGNGGGVFSSSGTFAGNYIEENSANNGGGISSGSGTTYDENVIRYNSADSEGGGGYVSGQPTLTNNWITYNHTQQGQTGGIFVAHNASLLQIAGDPDENSYNRIWGNEGYQLYNNCSLVGDNNLQAQYICWGTDDSDEIQAGIFDFYVDSTHAFVYWAPAVSCLPSEPIPSGIGCPAGLNGYGGGYGTTNKPYLIYTAEQLQAVGAYHFDWDRNFKLMADIDLNDLGQVNFNIIGGPPIANPVAPGKGFSGVFDGNGYTIANFYHVSTGLSDIGLFGFVTGGEIKNLGLISPDVDADGAGNVGALVGYAIQDTVINNCYVEGGTVANAAWSIGGLAGIVNGTVTNCHTSCSVAGDTSVGGLIGGMHGTNAVISHCYATGDIQGTNTYVGGLVGNSGYPGNEIKNCYASGNVEGFEHVGGLVGADSGSYIHDCYASGTAQGERWVGGLVGSGHNLQACYATGDVYGYGYTGGLMGDGRSIYDCFATGDVFVLTEVATGPGNFGGLVGHTSGVGEIARCFATGNVNGAQVTTAQGVGGLVGRNTATISDCYARGSVFGDRHIGGLVASNLNAIYRCYATGKVSGNDQVGGMVGFDESYGRFAIDSFWDTQSSAMPTSKGGTGKTTTQMFNQNTYLNAGWDFVGEDNNGTENIWMMTNTSYYPYLAWEQNAGQSYELYALTITVSSGPGYVVPNSNSYPEGTGVTLTAIPDPGYKVKLWQGTDDDLSRSETNYVTMDSDKNVTIAFEEITQDTVSITKMTIKPGSNRTNHTDSIGIFCESFDAVSDDLLDGENIGISIFNAGDPNAVFEEVMLFRPEKMRNGRYRDQNNDMKIKFDLHKETLELSAHNIDLTGLNSPVEFMINIGDYIGAGTAYDGEAKGQGREIDVINGKKPAPIQLLYSCEDYFRVDKCTFELGTKKPVTDSLVIRGVLAVQDISVDMASEDIVVTWGDYDIILPADDLYRIGPKKAFKYKKPKGADSSVAAAIFDLEKCTFKIIVKKANIGSQNNPVDFSIQFADFSRTVTLRLTEKKPDRWCFP